MGMDYADVCYQVSTTDIDGVLNVAAEFQPDGVFTLATDMPVRTAAVCERVGASRHFCRYCLEGNR